MKITFLTVGRTEFPFVREGIAVYEKRIVHYTGYQRIELPELKGTQSLTSEQIKDKEAAMILKALKPADEVILLDEKGTKYSSVQWAGVLEKKMIQGSRSMIFVVGGAYGFSKEIYSRADGMLSLSPMTLSHQIVRLFFVEQLYRAFTIIKGEPYHNE